MNGPGQLSASFASLLFLLAGCVTTVPVPPASQDHAPVISINAFPVAGQGGSTPSTMKSTDSSHAMIAEHGSKLMITGHANNPAGGVRDFRMTVRWNGGSASNWVEGHDVPDANGQVRTGWGILGTNGSHEPGNIPLNIEIKGTAGSSYSTAQVEAEATNFNGMTTKLVIPISCSDCPPPRPPSANLNASPYSLWDGQPSTLQWSVSNCDKTCEIELEGVDLDRNASIMRLTRLAATGSHVVTPRLPVRHVRYTLSATGANGTAQATKDVYIARAPVPTPLPEGKFYFFRMRATQPNPVTPCFGVAMWAASEASAKQQAEAQNGGYTASAITEAEYLAGCP